ncbi:hypothetical protein GIB67_041138 [Kingdonia uniflora]|uniref:GDSL esterase/lipase n=1 Tax=Kingdonia uniflora TaxID=39325 RepID=A0A7J7LKK5_9MAGN|nr:hypothetical protein GIB67_041138 [Kingdonia uniflora]
MGFVTVTCLMLLVFIDVGYTHNVPVEEEPITLVPALIIFGDSTVDVGNNDYIHTIFKANHPPYGRDFENHKPTGRFSNGKITTDIIGELLGFTTYPAPYLSPEASGKNLLIGANFASAGSGYYAETTLLNNAISLREQLAHFKEYQRKLTKVAGPKKAASIIKDALYTVGFGTSDFLQNYYINPLLNLVQTPEQYSAFLVAIFENFISDLYRLGARRIGVTGLPPIGCLPAVITMFGYGSDGCVSRKNSDARCFNRLMNATETKLTKKYPDLHLVVLDIYNPLLDIIHNPATNGFKETRKGCCGTGLFEFSLLCNRFSIGTCSNATDHVFWDGVHPSEATNMILADSLLTQGVSLLG